MVDVHFECFIQTLSFVEQLLSLRKLLGLRLKLGNLFNVGSGDLTGLAGEQVECNLPLACGDGSFNCLPTRTRVDLVRHCRLSLLKGHQVVTPLFFKLTYVTWE